MPRHMAADFGQIGLAGARFVDQGAVKHHHDAVGELQKLVEIFC